MGKKEKKILCEVVIDMFSESEDADGFYDHRSFSVKVPEADLFRANSIASWAAYEALKEAGFPVEGMCH